LADFLSLPEQLTLAQARGALEQLLAAIGRQPPGAPVRVRAEALRVFDSSALGVLLECRRAALADGRGFAVAGLPAGLAGLAALYGVEGLLAGAASAPSPAG
jgi:phospholipid transport system transporter-binding protein